MLLQQPAVMHGFETETREITARSRRGRTIKPKRRLEDEVDARAANKACLRGTGSSDTAGHYALEDYASDPEDARPAGVSGAFTASESRNDMGLEYFTRKHKETEGDKVHTDTGICKTGGIFKTAAVQVLRQTGRLMCTGDITRVAVASGFINVQGKTPDATMASALYTDIKRKEGRSIFIKPHEGLFGLREWWEMGHRFQDPKEQVPRCQAPPVRSSPELAASNSFAGNSGHKRTREILAIPRQAKIRRSGSSGGRASMTPKSAPKLHCQPQFESKMDILFAAVDEVSRDEPGAASSDSAEEGPAMGTSAFAMEFAMQQQPELRNAEAETSSMEESQPEIRSGSPSDMSGPLEVDGVTQMPPEAPWTTDQMMLRLQINQAELVVQALETNYVSHPTVLSQAYMQLCKLYGDAGMLEQACSSLSRAMEIGELGACMA